MFFLKPAVSGGREGLVGLPGLGLGSGVGGIGVSTVSRVCG